eukprot:Anaeramoba_ignava/c21751_g1_i2.p1 GENE.c21751_g1_i2~~c21751_g1_i2.p1  ORF type:complete len:257 (+),score=65.19 c21751_g1_i2:509-1279(+)
MVISPYLISKSKKKVSHKFYENFYLSTHYFLAIVFGIWVLRDKLWFKYLFAPWTDRTNLWISDGELFPPDIKLFYIWQLAFYIVDLPFATQEQKQPLIMLLHHLTTITLVGSSFYTIHYQIGTLLLTLHDISDVFLYSAKTFGYVDLNTFKDISFVFFTTTFFYFRLIILPILDYSSAVEYKGRSGFFGDFVMGPILITILVILHINWFWLILKIIYQIVTHSKLTDIRSDSEVEDGEPVKHHQKPDDADDLRKRK